MGVARYRARILPGFGLAAILAAVPGAALAQAAAPATNVPPVEMVKPIDVPADTPATVAAAPALAPTVPATVAAAPASSEGPAIVQAALAVPAAPAASPAQASQPAPDAPISDLATGDESGDNAQKYCTNIADAAADARYARQVQALNDLSKQVDERVAALEKKRAEYEDWLTKREEFLRKADESVVAIFTQMRPDAASQQMSVMDMGAAAAILVKLNPRIASAILNEMDPAKAAELTTTMAGLARPSDEAKPG